MINPSHDQGDGHRYHAQQRQQRGGEIREPLPRGETQGGPPADPLVGGQLDRGHAADGPAERRQTAVAQRMARTKKASGDGPRFQPSRRTIHTGRPR